VISSLLGNQAYLQRPYAQWRCSTKVGVLQVAAAKCSSATTSQSRGCSCVRNVTYTGALAQNGRLWENAGEQMLLLLLLLLALYVIAGGCGWMTGRHVVVASVTGETQHQLWTCELAVNYLRFMSYDGWRRLQLAATPPRPSAARQPQHVAAAAAWSLKPRLMQSLRSDHK